MSRSPAPRGPCPQPAQPDAVNVTYAPSSGSGQDPWLAMADPASPGSFTRSIRPSNGSRGIHATSHSSATALRTFASCSGTPGCRYGPAPDSSYGVIILDAYSSDAVPVHLLTREALDLYLTKLAPGGILLFHISNTHLDLEPTLAALARRAGLVCLVQDDTSVSPAEAVAGKYESQWAVMARDHGDLGDLATDSRWKPAGRIRPAACGPTTTQACGRP